MHGQDAQPRSMPQDSQTPDQTSRPVRRACVATNSLNRIGGTRIAVSIQSVTFLDDHKKIRNNITDFKNEGEVKTPQSTRGSDAYVYASYTKSATFRISMEINVVPLSDPPETFRIVGSAPWAGLTFESADLSPDSGKHVIELHSTPLPNRIARLSGDIQWTVQIEDTSIGLAPTVNVVLFVTMDTPLGEAAPAWEEDGITIARMEAAMSWIEPLNTLDPFEITSGLMQHFSGYTLGVDPAVPKQHNQPSYYSNSTGGAWPLYQFVNQGAHCQAIARLVRGMLRQVGVRGISVLRVWGDPRLPPAAGVRPPYMLCMAVMENDWKIGAPDGLDWSQSPSPRHLQTAWWVGEPVEVGDGSPGGDRPSPSVNYYEACVKVTVGKEDRYFPGGVDLHGRLMKQAGEVIEVFWGLVWTENEGRQGSLAKVVRKIEWSREQCRTCARRGECQYGRRIVTG